MTSTHSQERDDLVAQFSATPRLGRRSLLGVGLATAGAAGLAALTGGPASAAPEVAAEARIDLSPSSVNPATQSLVAIPRGRVKQAVAALDVIIGEVLAKTGVPGLSAAVVHDGNLLYAKGFGVRDVTTGRPVDAETVFHLASVSKSLSATVVAGLAGPPGRAVLSWTDPIARHLPGFALADDYVTRHVTYADLFSHSSGLPDHAGDLLEDLGFDQAYILHALRHEPLAPFRANYAYTNFGLTAAAVSAAAAAGADWATIADRALFHPLRMTRSSFRNSDFIRRRNRAAMHVRIDGRWLQKYHRDADPEAPAGGATSNVLDLATWMRFRLANGTEHHDRLINAAALLNVATPHSVSAPPATPDARTGFYGLGTNVSVDYSGRVRIGHSGAFAQGAATNYALLPDQRLGIAILTNGMPIGVPEAISSYFLDLVVGGTIENDWLALFTKVFAQLYVNPSKLAGKKPPRHPRPARESRFYTGRYRNDFYGPITVRAHHGTLHVLIGPRPTDYLLRHWNGETFAFYPTGENALGISAATFSPHGGRHARELTLEYYDATGLGTFRHA